MGNSLGDEREDEEGLRKPEGDRKVWQSSLAGAEGQREHCRFLCSEHRAASLGSCS